MVVVKVELQASEDEQIRRLDRVQVVVVLVDVEELHRIVKVVADQLDHQIQAAVVQVREFQVVEERKLVQGQVHKVHLVLVVVAVVVVIVGMAVVLRQVLV